MRVIEYKDPSGYLSGSKSVIFSQEVNRIFNEKVVTHHEKLDDDCINFDCKNKVTQYEIDRQSKLHKLTKYNFCKTCRNYPKRIQLIHCMKCSEPFRPENMRATCDSCRGKSR